MRDLLVTVLVFGSLPFILRNPVNGVLMWIWISVMNPHTQGWGFATSFPFAMIIGAATLFSVAVSHQPKTLPPSAIAWTLVLFIAWMNVTTLFALFPATAHVQWNKVMKIMLMSLVTMMVIRSRDDIQRMIWVLTLSLGFYGVKGGIFTLRSGGENRVWGPPDTFIGDNNALALALIMTLPLMRYLQQCHASGRRRWLWHGLNAMMLLSALAALGSYSRGGLLAIAAMIGFAWLQSRNKLVSAMLIGLFAPLALLFMPERWSARMDSIGDYQSDGSAMGRINAWWMAYNLACDRFFGGGFEIAEPSTFLLYAPNPHAIHAAHSIYFQALGEHGFIGLAIYLVLGMLTWQSAAWIVRHSRGHADLAWAGQLARMIQTSLVAFAVGGAFLSLLYYDVPYYLMAAIAATRIVVARQLGASAHRLPSSTAHAATRRCNDER